MSQENSDYCCRASIAQGSTISVTIDSTFWLGLSYKFLPILIHAVSLATDKGLNCSVSGCRKMNDPNASLRMNDGGSVPQTKSFVERCDPSLQGIDKSRAHISLQHQPGIGIVTPRLGTPSDRFGPQATVVPSVSATPQNVDIPRGSSPSLFLEQQTSHRQLYRISEFYA